MNKESQSSVPFVTKADGSQEPFDIKKLTSSLVRSGASVSLAKEVAEHVNQELVGGITTNDIYRHAFIVLKKKKRYVAANYSLKRALTAFGPSGYPFETFLGELFRAEEYSTLTRQIVKGACVDHEVDVVAWKPDSMIMVEAKFHNNHQFKTDLKVALYVKARFDDLKSKTHLYGGEQRYFTEGCLVTNTKFSSAAIQYSNCAGQKLIGWNYPHGNGSLQNLIEQSGLHPITALTTLEAREKQDLLLQGAVLCRNLGDNPEMLGGIKMSSKRIDAVLEEVDGLCGLKPGVFVGVKDQV